MSDRAPIRRPAAFVPTKPPTPRCPVCWSAPHLGPTRSVRRGWRVQAGEVEETPGSVISVASTVYPCSNPDCRTAIAVRMALTGGYLAADVADNLLRDADAAAFTRGRTTRDGVWRDHAGDARTEPVQRELFASPHVMTLHATRLQQHKSARVLGSETGRIRMAEDFDTPLA